jgi:excisionase family DNA binding protein
MNPDATSVLNIEEVSRWLRVPKSTLYKMCAEGLIPSTKIGKHWRFDRSVVEDWFKRRTTKVRPN